LRQIFANNNRQPSLGCGDETAGLRARPRPVKANGGIDSPFVSLSSRDVISSAAFRLTAFPLCYSSGTRYELAAALRRVSRAFPARLAGTKLPRGQGSRKPSDF